MPTVTVRLASGEEKQIKVRDEIYSDILDCMCKEDVLSIRISEGVKTIGRVAFYGCTSLISVIIPLSCTIVMTSAFGNCPRLSIVVAPQIFKSKGTTKIRSAFRNCPRLLDTTTLLMFPERYRVGRARLGRFTPIISEAILSGRELGHIIPHSREAIRSVQKLEYWSRDTHNLCVPRQRDWIFFLLLVLNRLELPYLVQMNILRYLKRYEIGIRRM